MSYHSDHYSYHFIGLDIAKANDSDIENYDKQVKEKISEYRQARIKELELQIQELKDQELNEANLK